MTYQVIIPRPVQKQLDNLPTNIRHRILKQLLRLKDNPRLPGYIKLKRYDNEYRIRIGNYRVRYEIRGQESIILPLHCKHRKDVYKD